MYVGAPSTWLMARYKLTVYIIQNGRSFVLYNVAFRFVPGFSWRCDVLYRNHNKIQLLPYAHFSICDFGALRDVFGLLFCRNYHHRELQACSQYESFFLQLHLHERLLVAHGVMDLCRVGMQPYDFLVARNYVSNWYILVCKVAYLCGCYVFKGWSCK